MLLQQKLVSYCFILSRILKCKEILFEKQTKGFFFFFFAAADVILPYLNAGPVITAVTVIRAEPWIWVSCHTAMR